MTGRPCNADAVVANFDRIAKLVEKLQASAYCYGQVLGFSKGGVLEGVEATMT